MHSRRPSLALSLTLFVVPAMLSFGVLSAVGRLREPPREPQLRQALPAPADAPAARTAQPQTASAASRLRSERSERLIARQRRSLRRKLRRAREGLSSDGLGAMREAARRERAGKSRPGSGGAAPTANQKPGSAGQPAPAQPAPEDTIVGTTPGTSSELTTTTKPTESGGAQARTVSP